MPEGSRSNWLPAESGVLSEDLSEGRIRRGLTSSQSPRAGCYVSCGQPCALCICILGRRRRGLDGRRGSSRGVQES